ncbi:MAG: hypothetical protein NT009_08065 [Proteobacteria bacterium]|nr:hypothetical protein [Pseudomonadota bacterium]
MGSHDNRRTMKMRRKNNRRKKKEREKRARAECTAKKASREMSAVGPRVVRVRSQVKPEEPGAARTETAPGGERK